MVCVLSLAQHLRRVRPVTPAAAMWRSERRPPAIDSLSKDSAIRNQI